GPKVQNKRLLRCFFIIIIIIIIKRNAAAHGSCIALPAPAHTSIQLLSSPSLAAHMRHPFAPRSSRILHSICSLPPLFLPLFPLLFFVHLALPQPPYLIARVVHHSSPKPLRRSLHPPCASILFTPSTSGQTQSPLSYTPIPVRLSSNTTSTSRPGSYSYSFAVAAPPGDGTEKGPFASELITLHEPFGQYFAVMELGSPASEIAVIIDTGSEITWVQCEPCLECSSQIRDPIFNPSRSQTYRKLQCHSNWCHDTSGLTIGCPKSRAFSSAVADKDDSSSFMNSTECIYNATYGDNSVSYGELSVDTLTIPSASGRAVAIPKFVFGCGRVNTGVETDFNASGLMGLNRGTHSIISQLGMQKFAYCLPDRSHNIDAVGFVVFGNYHPPSKNTKGAIDQAQPSFVREIDKNGLPPMQYVKLLLNNKSDFYAQSYYVNLTGVRIGEKLLDIPLQVFDIDPNTGDGGTIIDTGTSLTSFIDHAYKVFKETIRTQVSGDVRPIDIPELPSFDTCYTVGRGEGWPRVPEMYLQFDGGATEVRLPDGNLWLQVGTEGDRNLYCLAFATAGEGTGGRNVIGNFQQQNLMVDYDVVRAHIGFVHLHRCSDAQITFDSCLGFLFVSVVIFLLSSS
ncbi:hypothetical protein GOP47_0015046, partial [Adiantum capillus-veneris]